MRQCPPTKSSVLIVSLYRFRQGLALCGRLTFLSCYALCLSSLCSQDCAKLCLITRCFCRLPFGLGPQLLSKLPVSTVLVISTLLPLRSTCAVLAGVVDKQTVLLTMADIG
jgi:hypothetical protein